jgi:hypothetical protein
MGKKKGKGLGNNSFVLREGKKCSCNGVNTNCSKCGGSGTYIPRNANGTALITKQNQSSNKSSGAALNYSKKGTQEPILEFNVKLTPHKNSPFYFDPNPYDGRTPAEALSPDFELYEDIEKRNKK